MNSASLSHPLQVNRALHTSQPLQGAENPQTALPTSNHTEPITTLAQRGSNQLSLETPQNKAG
jgi:NADH dehydrogenase (ubiquinone) Fe-S protein 7